MKKLIYLCFALVLCSETLIAQYSFKEHYFERNKESTGAKHFVQLSGAYNANSSRVSNAFISKLYFGGFIDTDLKNSARDRLIGENTIGFDANAVLEYKLALEKFNITFSIGQDLQSNNSFTKNFYNLYLYGNAPFAGTQLDVAEITAHVQSYRHYGIGLEKMFDDYFIGGQIKLYQGKYLYDAYLERGSFLTEVDGSKITVDPKLELSFLKETNKFNPGVGIDFYVARKFKQSMVFFDVQDLGFINYQDVTSFSVDSTYEYEGIRIENIFAIGDQQFDITLDSLNKIFGVSIDQKTVTKLTPARFTFGFQEVVSDRLLVEVSANYRLLPKYTPQVIVKPNIFATKNLSFAPVVSVGGLGRADIGLNVSYHHSKFFTILDVFEIENLISPEKTSGRGALLKAGFLF